MFEDITNDEPNTGGKRHEADELKGMYPCNKTGCESYCIWSVVKTSDDANGINVSNGHNPLYCMACVYFNGIDLKKE